MEKVEVKTNQEMEKGTGSAPAVSVASSDQVLQTAVNSVLGQASSITANASEQGLVAYRPLRYLESSVAEQQSSRLLGLVRLRKYLERYVDLRSLSYRASPSALSSKGECLAFLTHLATVSCAPSFCTSALFTKFEILLGENTFPFVAYPHSPYFWHSWSRLWHLRNWLMHLGALFPDPWLPTPVYRLPFNADVPIMVPAGSGQDQSALTLMELPRDIHCLIFARVQLSSSRDAMNMMMSSRYWMQLGRSELRHIDMKELGLSARTQALLVSRLPKLESVVNARLPTSNHLALFLRCLPHLRVLESEVDAQWPDVLDCTKDQQVLPKDVDIDMPPPRDSGLPLYAHAVTAEMRGLVDRRLKLRLENIRTRFIGPLPSPSSQEAVALAYKTFDYVPRLCSARMIALDKITLHVCSPMDDAIRVLGRVLVPNCLREFRLIGRMEDAYGLNVRMGILTEVLATQSRLEVLHVECTSMEPESADMIANLPALRTLRIHHSFIHGAEVLKLSRSPQLRQTLTELSLVGSMFCDYMLGNQQHMQQPNLQLFGGPKMKPHTSFLFGGGPQVDDYSGPQGLINVRVLNLRSVRNITVDCEQMANQLPHLVSIDIRDIKSPDRVAKTARSPVVINPTAFFSQALCPDLEELSYDHNSRISLSDMPAVIKQLPATLLTLRLSGGRFTQRSVEELVKQCPNLRTLDLSFVVTLSNKVFKSLYGLSHLTYLNMRCAGNMASGITDVAVLDLLLPKRNQIASRMLDVFRESIENESIDVERIRLMLRQMIAESNSDSQGDAQATSNDLSALETIVLGNHPLTPLSLLTIAVCCPHLRFLRIGRWSVTTRTLTALFTGCRNLQSLAVEMPPVRLALVEDGPPSIDPLQYRNSLSSVLSTMRNTKSVLTQKERDSLDVRVVPIDVLGPVPTPLAAAEYCLQKVDGDWEKKVQTYIEDRCAPFTSVLHAHGLPSLQDLLRMKNAGLLRQISESPTLSITTSVAAVESTEESAADASSATSDDIAQDSQVNEEEYDRMPKRRRVDLDDGGEDDKDEMELTSAGDE